ncbi:MAG: hypothetical protein ACTSSH_10580 [Candidatus Heimdallarchaeota archaeon]
MVIQNNNGSKVKHKRCRRFTGKEFRDILLIIILICVFLPLIKSIESNLDFNPLWFWD